MAKANAKSNETKAALEKVEKLVSVTTSYLQTEDKDLEEEARSSAVQAIRIMKENGLVIVPQAVLERAKQTVSGSLSKEERNKNIFMGAALGFVAAQSGLLRGVFR